MVSPENPKQWRIENARYVKGARFQFRSWVYVMWWPFWEGVLPIDHVFKLVPCEKA
jgi:hypothetical protein